MSPGSSATASVAGPFDRDEPSAASHILSSSSSSFQSSVIDRQRFRAVRPELSLATSQQVLYDYSADLKHCAICGQALESLAADIAMPPAPTTRVISIGGHAFTVNDDERRPPSSMHGRDEEQDGSDTSLPLLTTTDDGRQICQTCSDAASSRTDRNSRNGVMDIDTGQSITDGRPMFSHTVLQGPSQARRSSPDDSLMRQLPAGTGIRGADGASNTLPATFDNNLAIAMSIMSGSRHQPSLSPNRRLSEVAAAPPRDASLDRSSPSPGRGDMSRAEPFELPMSSQSRDQSLRRQQVTPVEGGSAIAASALAALEPAARMPNRDTQRGRDQLRPRLWGEEAPVASASSLPSPPSSLALDSQIASSSAVPLPRLSTSLVTARRIRSSAPAASRGSSMARSTSTDTGNITRQRESSWSARLSWFRPEFPDPVAEISRIRMPSKGQGCLYPGSIYNGTQRSGRLSYDVTVEILNVDMTHSHLEGYLNIRGLTEDWPELTTFFTAEIIGKDHDFVTGRWGATEADDLKHWNRFAPFQAIHQQLPDAKRRFNHFNKPYVFMRWKERFLVPDWRVRDISGASFAGFYYVCAFLGDPSEWTPGSADPSTTRFSATAPPFTPDAAVSSPSFGTSPSEARRSVASSSVPRTRTPVSHRRLGNQNVTASADSLPIIDMVRRVIEAISTGSRALAFSALPRSSADVRTVSDILGASQVRATLEGDLLEREILRLAALRGDRAGTEERTELAVRLARSLQGGDNPLVESLMGRAESRPSTSTGPAILAGAETRAAVDLAFGLVSSIRSHDRGNVSVDVLMDDVDVDVDVDADAEPSQASQGGAGSVAAAGLGTAATVSVTATASATETSTASLSMEKGQISAFYYHENSEPYQQLDLRHIEKAYSASFEMR